MVPAAPVLPVTEPVSLAVEQRAGPPEVVDVDVDGAGDVEEVGEDDVLDDEGAWVVDEDDEFEEHAPSAAPPRARAATTPSKRLLIHDSVLVLTVSDSKCSSIRSLVD